MAAKPQIEWMEAMVLEAERLEMVARLRVERAMAHEEEGRQWEAAAKAREKRLQRSLQIHAEMLAVWESRAEAWEVEWRRREAASRTREERLQRSVQIQVERTTAWEARAEAVEAREMLWRRRAEEQYIRAGRLERTLEQHSGRLAILQATLFYIYCYISV